MTTVKNLTVLLTLTVLSVIANGQELKPVQNKKGLWGYVNEKGKIVIPYQYQQAFEFNKGIATVKLNNKWGFIDKTNKEVISFKYDDIAKLSEDLVKVKLNNKWGAIDITGREVIDLKYDNLKQSDTGFLEVMLNNLIGLFDKKGNEIIPVKYHKIELVSNGLYAVCLYEKWGFTDLTGKEITSLKYNSWYDAREGMLGVEIGGKFGFVDNTGKEVIPLKYNVYQNPFLKDKKPTYFNEGVIALELESVESHSKWGVVDNKGNLIIKHTHLYPKYAIESIERYEKERQANSFSNFAKKYVEEKMQISEHTPPLFSA